MPAKSKAAKEAEAAKVEAAVKDEDKFTSTAPAPIEEAVAADEAASEEDEKMTLGKRVDRLEQAILRVSGVRVEDL